MIATTVNKPNTTLPPPPRNSDSAMVWGCFSGRCGKGGLFFLSRNTKLNAYWYIGCLEDHLLLILSSTLLHSFYVWQCSLPPGDHNTEVPEWLGNSPDLIPIENCWNQMKKLNTSNTSSIKKSESEIQKLWMQELHLNYYMKLTVSMPERLMQGIETIGHMTKY